MRGIYEIVSLSTTWEDISFTFQRYNGYTGLKIIKHTSQIVDVLYTHDVSYLGMLKETNKHVK